jgi:glycosyltransferase 2 family protein
MNTKHASSENKSNGIVGKFITSIIIGITVFSLFFLWGDVQSVKAVITSIPMQYIGLAILFTLLSYSLRFVKWHYFLRYLKINISVRDSFNIFFIGLSMSITPGKVGELLKSYLIKNVSGTEISRSEPIVIVDRLTDLFAMLVLVSVGITIFSFSYVPIIVVFMTLLLFVAVLQSSKLSMKIIDFLTRFLFKKHKTAFINLYESTQQLLKVRLLTLTTIISVVAWFMECISLFILLKALGLSLGIIESTFIFSFGTVAGALSMVPGGLGVAEGSITGLLMYFHIDKSVAVSITLLIRLVTLWLGVIIGLLIFFKKRKTYMIKHL